MILFVISIVIVILTLPICALAGNEIRSARRVASRMAGAVLEAAEAARSAVEDASAARQLYREAWTARKTAQTRMADAADLEAAGLLGVPLVPIPEDPYRADHTPRMLRWPPTPPAFPPPPPANYSVRPDLAAVDAAIRAVQFSSPDERPPAIVLDFGPAAARAAASSSTADVELDARCPDPATLCPNGPGPHLWDANTCGTEKP